jgi:hypothetical protein
MPRTALAYLGLAAALLAAAPAGRAEAQSQHTYVSRTGSGTVCDRATPCLDLATAHAATSSGGSVTCIDGGPGSLGPLTITKSITIECPGTVYSIVVGGIGITVRLRHMTVSSLGAPGGPGIGIDFQEGAALLVEDCIIQNYTPATTVAGPGIGIRFAPPNSETASLHVTDSIISGNGLAASGGGIIVQPAGSGSARVVIERTQVENNTYGIFANGTGSTGLISVQVRDSVVSNSAFSGITSFASAGHSIVSTVVDRSSSLLNGANGILAQGGNAFVFLSESTAMSNVTGLNPASGGAIFSYQNNRLTGNVTDGAATGVLTLK